MDKKLVNFLVTAKKATYAGKGAETIPSRLKSHDLIYNDGDYKWFSGIEKIFYKKKMVYECLFHGGLIE